ncbi:AMIN domain-containing protein [Desulfobaculum bizertense]|uniref:AMIN domain-containing protein n=1 Tax=Desulfobaculum bizertense DSM 18034 TaxID=1121442 RepID=A0A1T4VGQ4_9BACT|nr:AMIN domain-containing protein [Desulfobaculum bizertense]SKA64038.1 AMIN domain-containing protein [Desulfobaculum bizertense DSM 18034]
MQASLADSPEDVIPNLIIHKRLWWAIAGLIFASLAIWLLTPSKQPAEQGVVREHVSSSAVAPEKQLQTEIKVSSRRGESYPPSQKDTPQDYSQTLRMAPRHEKAQEPAPSTPQPKTQTLPQSPSDTHKMAPKQDSPAKPRPDSPDLSQSMASPDASQTVSSLSSQNILFQPEISAQGGQVHSIIFRSTSPLPELHTFSLKTPPRFIIDIDGSWTYRGRKHIAMQQGNLRAIRMGYHPDKIRIVLDLVSHSQKLPLVNTSDKGLHVQFKK